MDEPLLSWQIGSIRVTRVPELSTASLGPHLLPQATPAALAPFPWLAPFCDADGRIVLSMHTLLVETPEQVLLVDTCIGNDKERSYPRWNHMQTDFLARLSAAGGAPERVDQVLCTHMHVDHVGWNTRWDGSRWQPTFPRARYLYSAREWAHWQREEQVYGPVIEDSVAPIFDAGLAELVDDHHVVCAGIRLVPTPGHTPGHVSVLIADGGESAFITGDLVHHPCQLVHPEWSSTADEDADQAVATRQAFLDRYTEQPTLIIGTHFAAPTAGRLVRDGARVRLDY